MLPRVDEDALKCGRIVCIGNGLVADDGAGPAVYEILARLELPRGVSLDLLASGGISLLERLEGERTLVVVDAVQLGARPGTVHVLGWRDLPPAGPAVSAHGIGVREALEIGGLLWPEAMPREVTLVGIEGRCFDGLGQPMTGEVAAAVPRAAALALALARGGERDGGEWRHA